MDLMDISRMIFYRRLRFGRSQFYCVKKLKTKFMGVSPNGDTKSDVGQQVWVLVDAVDCRDGNLCSLDSILLPVRSTTISISKNYIDHIGYHIVR